MRLRLRFRFIESTKKLWECHGIIYNRWLKQMSTFGLPLANAELYRVLVY